MSSGLVSEHIGLGAIGLEAIWLGITMITIRTYISIYLYYVIFKQRNTSMLYIPLAVGLPEADLEAA